ncbi:MAG TPA: Hsp33 family molecular chaperone HslO [Burkholderiaceae bacterium]
MPDRLLKFLFNQAPVRGEVVRLSQSWQRMTALHAYPEPVLRLLGETTAAATLLSATIKFAGNLILQIHGDGPVQLLVVECQPDLAYRATAKLRTDARIEVDAGWHELVNAGGQGRCAITLDPGKSPAGQQRYQGIVPLQGSSVAEALEAYLRQSEQIESRLWLAADGRAATGLLLQRIARPSTPGAEQDEDAWRRTTTLSDTVSAAELLESSAEEMVHRLFWQERLERHAPVTPRFACTCSRGRTGRMLLTLGRPEVDSILAEQGLVSVTCEFCGAQYAFDAVDVGQLFATGSSEATRPDAQH